MKFNQMQIISPLQKALSEQGFLVATQVQQTTLLPILEGEDVVVRSQTGSGKTFAFALPLLQKVDYENPLVQTLIVCPTRELALQVYNEIKKISKYLNNFKIVPIYGGNDMTRQIVALKKKPQMVVGTPGRIIDHLKRRTLKLHGLKTLVLDEADEMLNMGFKEDIEYILKDTPSSRQTLMFSATFPLFIRQIIKDFMLNPQTIEVGEENKSLSSIKQFFANVKPKDKKDTLLEFFAKIKPKHPIIFTNTKAMADDLAKLLKQANYPAHALHGELKQSQRKKVLQEIKQSATSILVASDVAARGLDINDIDYVINFDLPNNVEYFLHRIGRTARAGKEGNAFSIISSKDQLYRLKDFEKITNSNIEELIFTNSLSPSKSKEAPRKDKRSSSTKNFARKNRPSKKDDSTYISSKERSRKKNNPKSSSKNKEEKGKLRDKKPLNKAFGAKKKDFFKENTKK